MAGKRLLITQAGWLLILIVMLLGFVGYNSVLQNIETSDNKEILNRLNVSSTRNQLILDRNTEVLKATAEIRDSQIKDISETQNRTANLLPAFVRSIEQVAHIEEFVNETEDIFQLQKSAQQDRILMISQLHDINNTLTQIAQSFNNSSTNP